MVNYIEEAQRVFDIEVEGMNAVRNNLGQAFETMVDMCRKALDNEGKIIFSGVGKSGHIGYKLSATFASTGSPAAFLNPVEAMHGDLGMVSPRDIMIAISYSGETDELLPVVPAVQRFGVPVIAITGAKDSRLAEFSDHTMPMPIPQEACPFGLAPTTSTTALLALGDALGVVLLKARGFSKEQFGLYHPGGSIGRSVTLKVNDVMRNADELPTVTETTTVSDCIMMMTQKRSGSVLVINESGVLTGIFADGDFRRHAQDGIETLMASPISEVMTKNPTTILDNSMAVELMKILEERKIDDIPVVSPEGKPVGLIDIQDLPRFKLL